MHMLSVLMLAKNGCPPCVLAKSECPLPENHPAMCSALIRQNLSASSLLSRKASYRNIMRNDER